jgi:hypothetical protein
MKGLDSLSFIGGWLYFSDNMNLRNFNGLLSIDSLPGRLRIEDNERMTSFSGFDSLEYVGGLWVYNQDSVIDMTGFQNLRRINRFFEIVGNERMINFNGLNNLKRIDWFVRIEDNASLKNMSGLDSLNSIDGYLKVEYNDSLTNFDGIGVFDSIPGHLYVTDNDQLEDLSGLDHVEFIGKDLEIVGNDSLKNLSDLISLKSVQGAIRIIDNKMLGLLDGIDSIDHTGITELVITNCDSLSICGVTSICNYITSSGSNYTISGNASGCSSFIQVLNTCFVGIDVNVKSNFEIFPNPTKEYLYINKVESGYISYSMLDLYGQQVLNGVLENDGIDVGELDNGFYLIKLLYRNQEEIFRVIKTQ